VVTYGLEPGADLTAADVELNARGASFAARLKGSLLGRFAIHVPGRHNVQNALAAVAVGLELGLSREQLVAGLEKFRGADRRFQVKGSWEGVTVVDDYGHHPTEIRATLEAARLTAPKRLWVIFQPHRYTRTQFLMDDFARCFDGCDRVYVLDIYPASEPALPGITSQRLVERMRELGYDRARYAASDQEVIREVLAEVRPGDLVMTIGAGSITKTAESLAEAFRNAAPSAVGRDSEGGR
jgi:UDP-N-acetylmuramate--alanine ligase